ncbi:MAG: IMP cyclohydrolase [bacterium]
MSDLTKAYKTLMDDHFPETMTIDFGGRKLVYRKRTWKIADKNKEIIEKGLRYGENPGQEAALFELVEGNLELGDCRFIRPGLGLTSAIDDEEMVQAGKHPGKTNLTDIDNALYILKFLADKPAAAIMKHNNPCGVACGGNILSAYEQADSADKVAAFGGCAVFNRSLTVELAEAVARNYLEVVVAPEYEEGAVGILSGRKNLRIIRLPRIGQLADYRVSRFLDFKSLCDGGIIVQQSPLNKIRGKEDFMVSSATHQGQEYKIEREPDDREYADMLFGWAVEQGISSNSVIYVKDERTVGIGTGEQDRVGVARIAMYKAYTKYADFLCRQKFGISFADLELEVEQGLRGLIDKQEIEERTRKENAGLRGAVMISDAFFPFRDGVDVGIREGISGIVQPGGSLRDYEVIRACNEADPQVSMVFTGQRAFKH